MSRAKKNFMQDAVKNPGALHRSLNVPMDKNIPIQKIDKASRSNNPKLKKQAVLAKTFKKMASKRKGK